MCSFPTIREEFSDKLAGTRGCQFATIKLNSPKRAIAKVDRI